MPVSQYNALTWQSQLQRTNHPVVNVSWLNTLAYVQWLSRISNQGWRLPTEAEWEKAARWDLTASHARIYPWGDQWNNTRANTNENGPQDTTIVGAYAGRGDVSPYGCHDMCGNIFQWTSSIFVDDQYQNDANHENLTDVTNNRVERGGCWQSDTVFVRSAYRARNPPENYRKDYLGLRMAFV